MYLCVNVSMYICFSVYMYICIFVQRSVVLCYPYPLVYNVALLVIKQATKEEKIRAADQGVWALKASGSTIDFRFAW